MFDPKESFSKAKWALSEANLYCLKGSEITTQLKVASEQAVVLYSKLCFMRSGLSQQKLDLASFTNSVEVIVSKANRRVDLLISKLEQSQLRLDQFLDELDQIKMDKSLKGAGPPLSLKTFVNEDDISHLHQEIYGTKESLNTRKQNLLRHISTLQSNLKVLDTAVSPDIQDTADCTIHLADISSAAAESAQSMADWLEGLSRHYDLSCEAQTLEDKDLIAEAHQVLEGDQAKVDEAVELLIRETETLASLLAETEQVSSTLRNDMVLYQNQQKAISGQIDNGFRVEFDGIKLELQDSETQYKACEMLLSELSGLHDYYNGFVRSYHAMLLEIARREKAQAALASFLDQINIELEDKFTKECEARATFLDENKEFLPADIWGDMGQLPPEHRVELLREYIPHIAKSGILSAIQYMRNT